jgi:hypothetical protein
MAPSVPNASGSIILGATEARRLWNSSLARQGLSEETKFTTPREVAQATFGLHAARLQSPFATVLARVRTPALALELFTPSTRSNLMTVRCMRKTLHMLPLRLAAVAHAATVRFRERDAIRAIVNANVSLRNIEKIIDDMVSLLGQSGPLFHRHIEQRLLGDRRTVGAIRLAIRLAWESGTLVYLNHANGWNREDRRFALMAKFHPNVDMKLDRNTAIRELIEAYFDRYGPASIVDAGWWSGLPRSAILSGLRTVGREITTLRTPWTDAPVYMFRDRFEECCSEGAEMDVRRYASLNFLAHEDVALKAYFETRNRYLEGVPPRAVFNQIGEALPTILLGGRVIGTWKWNPKRMRIGWSPIPGRVPKALGTRVISRVEALSESFRLGCSTASLPDLS